MITVSLLLLSPETMQRMHDEDQVRGEIGGRPWERRAALIAACTCMLGALVAALLSLP